MEFQQFVSAVEEKISESVGEERSVRVHTAIKNNGTKRSGVTITEKGVNISPTIYLEEYYEQFMSGSRSMSQISERILELYEEVRFNRSWKNELIQTYDAVRHRIVFKLINRETNLEFLEDTPHMLFLDLAVVFYVLVEVNRYGTATMPVQNMHLKAWKVTKEEVYERACENTPRLLKADFRKMDDIIRELLSTQERNDELEEEGEALMYVLTNQIRSFGAACMLYDGVLEKIGSAVKENYFIIPSSIHEVIIVPESQSPSRRELKELIEEVNATQVEEEEVLSDCPYYYSRKGKRLIM